MHIYANVALLLLHRTRERERREEAIFFPRSFMGKLGRQFPQLFNRLFTPEEEEETQDRTPKNVKKAEVLGDTVVKQVWDSKTISI